MTSVCSLVPTRSGVSLLKTLKKSHVIQPVSHDLLEKEIVVRDKTQDCQNSISTADVDDPDSEKGDRNGSCEVFECPSEVTDTLLQEPDIVENGHRSISFAPGEDIDQFYVHFSQVLVEQ